MQFHRRILPHLGFSGPIVDARESIFVRWLLLESQIFGNVYPYRFIFGNSVIVSCFHASLFKLNVKRLISEVAKNVQTVDGLSN